VLGRAAGGGYLVYSLLDLSGFERGQALWLLVLLGGVDRIVLMMAVFNWALIVLSSMTGAGW